MAQSLYKIRVANGVSNDWQCSSVCIMNSEQVNNNYIIIIIIMMNINKQAITDKPERKIKTLLSI